MRIAVSGSHLVGKTTLAWALTDALPGYQLVPEPYHLLEEEGHLFAEMPSIEDFERQLERSIENVAESGPDIIFDRCPLDMLGYIVTHPEAHVFRLEGWMPAVQEAVAQLDRIVFVPIEAPDRIAVPPSEAVLRAEVDAALRDIVVDDEHGLGFDLILAAGGEAERLRRVLESLR